MSTNRHANRTIRPHLQVPDPFELTDEVLCGYLLHIGDDVSNAMLALRPGGRGTGFDAEAAYRELHHAVNDLAGVYNFARLGARIPPPDRPPSRGWRRAHQR